MRLTTTLGMGLALLMTAGCGFQGTTATGQRPAGAASTAPMAASKEPEPANSLPQGDAIAGPVTTNIGRVGTTRY